MISKTQLKKKLGNKMRESDQTMLETDVLRKRHLLRRHYFFADHIITNEVNIISLQPQEHRHVCKFRCNNKLSERCSLAHLANSNAELIRNFLFKR